MKQLKGHAFFVKTWSGRIEFPGVIGFHHEKAKELIKKEFPNFHFEVYWPGEGVYENYCETRVQLLVDKDGIVIVLPVNG